MGVASSINSTVNNVKQNVHQEFVNKSLSKAESNCTQKIKKINIGTTSFCNVTFKNDCYANAQSYMATASDLAVKLWSNLSAEQKAAAAAPLSATLSMQSSVNNIQINIEQSVKNYCQAKGYSKNKLVVDELYYGNCIGSPGTVVEIKFENIGHADANCVMNIIAEAAIKATNMESSKQSGFNWSDLLWPIVTCIVILAIVRIIFLFKTPVQDKIALERSLKDDWASRVKTLKE